MRGWSERGVGAGSGVGTGRAPGQAWGQGRRQGVGNGSGRGQGRLTAAVPAEDYGGVVWSGRSQTVKSNGAAAAAVTDGRSKPALNT